MEKRKGNKVKEKDFFEGWDERRACRLLSEDMLRFVKPETMWRKIKKGEIIIGRTICRFTHRYFGFEIEKMIDGDINQMVTIPRTALFACVDLNLI